MSEKLRITKPIRLIELFAGVGSQAMALRNIGANFERYLTCEWWVQAFASYKAIHHEDDHTDYSEGKDKIFLIDYLHKKGISGDGKQPMTLEQIQRKPEKWLRETYNNIQATHNIVNIVAAKGEDLKVKNTDQYTYILTYSFPCQDLSVAGKMRGMDKGSGTRSGMLWEVERLLGEMDELPQVLLMENVPQVMQQKNMHNFQAWQQFLESKGYKNYAQILNAKDYGVAQNRQRAFMVSILGDYEYTFPKPIPLDKCMADYLEDEVDESFYVNSEKADQLIVDLVESGKLEQQTSPTIRGGQRLTRPAPVGYDCNKIGFIDKGTGEHQSNAVYTTDGVSRCLDATDYKHKMQILEGFEDGE